MLHGGSGNVVSVDFVLGLLSSLRLQWWNRAVSQGHGQGGRWGPAGTDTSKALFHPDAEVLSTMAAGKTVWGVGPGEGFRPEAVRRSRLGRSRPG